VCWQLSYTLKCEVFEFTATGPASGDFKYRDQIRDSASGAPRCIAEGFGRFRPREFARFLEFARASLMETRNSLIDGRDSNYLGDALFSRLMNLAAAALSATTRLLRQKQAEGERRSRGSPPRTPHGDSLGQKRPQSRSFFVDVEDLKSRRGPQR